MKYKVGDIIESLPLGKNKGIRYKIIESDGFIRLLCLENYNIICKFETVKQMLPYIEGYKIIGG